MSFIQVIGMDGQAAFLRAESVMAIAPAGQTGCIVRLQGMQQGMPVRDTAAQVLALLQLADDQGNGGHPMFCVAVQQEADDLSEWAVRSILARQRAPQG